ncbi:hypothetical protein D3C79_862970 [compost metagenome]
MRTRIIIRSEHQPPAASEVEGKLTITITLKRMGVSGHQVGYPGSGLHRAKPYAKLLRAISPKLLLSSCLLLAKLANFLVLEIDLQAYLIVAGLYLLGKDWMLECDEKSQESYFEPKGIVHHHPRLLGVRSGHSPHLHLIPIPHQPILPSLHHLADPDHCLGVMLVSGQAQSFSNPHQLDRRPFQVRGQALEVAVEFLVGLG